MAESILRPVAWIGSSYKDFRAFPDPVQDAMGYALYWAQAGDLHASAKPLKGFGGASVIEIVEDHSTDTYRAIYTVRFSGASMCCTPSRRRRRRGGRSAQEMDPVRRRLRVAEEDHKRLTKGERP